MQSIQNQHFPVDQHQNGSNSFINSSKFSKRSSWTLHCINWILSIIWTTRIHRMIKEATLIPVSMELPKILEKGMNFQIIFIMILMYYLIRNLFQLKNFFKRTLTTVMIKLSLLPQTIKLLLVPILVILYLLKKYSFSQNFSILA